MNNAQEHNREFPELHKAGSRSPFEVPEGYFDTLPGQIRDRMHQPAPVKILTMPRLAVAACVAAVLVTGFYYLSDVGSVPQTSQIQITDEHIEEAGYLSLMDEDMILESISHEVLDSLQEETIFNDYLIENRTDINLIINEL